MASDQMILKRSTGPYVDGKCVVQYFLSCNMQVGRCSVNDAKPDNSRFIRREKQEKAC